MKLIKGQYYTITEMENHYESQKSIYKIKLPQKVLFDGNGFIVEDKDGLSSYAVSRFKFKPAHHKPNTLEIYPYRGGFRYRKIAANGKVLNHHYNTVAGAKKGAEAERKFWENFKIIVKK